MKRLFILPIIFLGLALASPSQAFDFNLINVDLGSSEGQKLTNSYGQAYGFTPQQTAPAMLGPAQEVPMIMKVAQAAGTVPMTVWMMRRMGMSVGNILSTFALGPSALLGGGGGSPLPYGPSYGNPSPWGGFTDPYMIQTSRVYFLNKILRVPMSTIPNLPFGGANYSRSLIYPYHPVHGTWMPPGIAKKYGLWTPPGQRKKVGWYGDWGKHHGKHHGKHYDKHHGSHDWKHSKGKHKHKDGHWGDEKITTKGKGPNGKWEYKYEKKGGKEKVEWKSKGQGGKRDYQYMAAKPGKGSGKGKSKGGSSKSKGKWK